MRRVIWKRITPHRAFPMMDQCGRSGGLSFKFIQVFALVMSCTAIIDSELAISIYAYVCECMYIYECVCAAKRYWPFSCSFCLQRRQCFLSLFYLAAKLLTMATMHGKKKTISITKWCLNNCDYQLQKLVVVPLAEPPLGSTLGYAIVIRNNLYISYSSARAGSVCFVFFFVFGWQSQEKFADIEYYEYLQLLAAFPCENLKMLALILSAI